MTLWMPDVTATGPPSSARPPTIVAEKPIGTGRRAGEMPKKPLSNPTGGGILERPSLGRSLWREDIRKAHREGPRRTQPYEHHWPRPLKFIVMEQVRTGIPDGRISTARGSCDLRATGGQVCYHTLRPVDFVITPPSLYKTARMSNYWPQQSASSFCVLKTSFALATLSPHFLEHANQNRQPHL